MPTDTNRTASSQRGRSTSSEVRGSLLDQRRPPVLPAGLPDEVALTAERIFRTNPHLWHEHQVAPVVRLARLYQDVEGMSDAIAEIGWWIENVKGDFKVNPLISTRNAVLTQALNLEKALMITSYHRQQTTAEEQAMPAGMTEEELNDLVAGERAKSTARVLRLA